jgi:hypothetical protein
MVIIPTTTFLRAITVMSIIIGGSGVWLGQRHQESQSYPNSSNYRHTPTMIGVYSDHSVSVMLQ